MASAARGLPVLAAGALAAGAALLGACSDQGKLRESELTQLLAWLPGGYEGTDQTGSGARTALTVTRVYTPRLGHHVLYAQETAADDPRRVLSQKLYSFDVEDKRGIVETLYQFVEPLRWRDGQRNPEVFTSVVTDDVRAEACQLLWKKTPAGFVASHDPAVCPDSGAAAAAPQAILGPGTLTSGEYRFRKSR
ncbi:MAG TPA: CpcT/CpeT family chromophore lyase [Steroidobacteraceae bacterium]|nr:CpcT/CpeT family chromophore lyase [Steroidobacteraceae bacterium]